MGVYPMLADNTCSFLAADFDEGDWRRDAFAFRDACERHGIPVAIERSRSGNGAHAWIFFDEPISATLARRLGAFLITDTMEHVPDIGFGSYDRFFPSQDFMPTGGFGNLIALPLQGLARSSGNSEFIDSSCLPYPDQWAFLSTIASMPRAKVEHLVEETSASGKILGVRIPLADEDEEPWLAPPSRRQTPPAIREPLPAAITVVQADQIYLPRHALPPSLIARRSKARYVLGLSATVARKDGHHPIIVMQCGPVRHRVDARSEAAKRPFDHVVQIRDTSFQLQATFDTSAPSIQDVFNRMIADEARNDLIFDDVLRALEAGGSPVVLTERTAHLEIIAKRLERFARHVVVLRGGQSEKQRRDVAARLAAIPQAEERVIVATGRYIGEGFDDSRLDTLFLTMPVAWKGTLAQYAGRLHRLNDAKREVIIYDYADMRVPVLARMAAKRQVGYQAIG